MHLDATYGRHILFPHPVTERGALNDLVEELSVKVVRGGPQQLRLIYRLKGDLAAMKFPEPRPPARADGLWRHSCFEAFIGHAGASDYWEFNFSPSTAWAAYHFSAYREGMAPLMKGAPPLITPHVSSDQLDLDVVLDLSWLARTPSSNGLRLGLAAVIEDKARVLSYWSLKHAAEKPDFHHPDSFVVELD